MLTDARILDRIWKVEYCGYIYAVIRGYGINSNIITNNLLSTHVDHKYDPTKVAVGQYYYFKSDTLYVLIDSPDWIVSIEDLINKPPGENTLVTQTNKYIPNKQVVMCSRGHICGYYVRDVDENVYINFKGEWHSAVHWYKDPIVYEAKAGDSNNIYVCGRCACSFIPPILKEKE